MSDAAERAHPQLECLREVEQTSGVDIADVAGDRVVDWNLALIAIERHAGRVVDVSLWVRHDVIDHVLGFTRDPIDDVIDADRLRDVMNEEDQPCDAEQREEHGAGDRGDRSKGLRKKTRRRQCGHAIREGAEEDTKRPLGHAILDKTDEDPRGELHGRECQRHEKDGEDDRHHRHDRTGDRTKDDLSDLGISTGRKKDGGNPGAQRRNGLFERRKHGAEKAEHDGDHQRPHQKPAAQRIHCGAEQGKQSVRHDPVSPV